jgi:hypothetical protein
VLGSGEGEVYVQIWKGRSESHAAYEFGDRSVLVTVGAMPLSLVTSYGLQAPQLDGHREGYKAWL